MGEIDCVFWEQSRERRLEQILTLIGGLSLIEHPYFPCISTMAWTLRWSLRPISLLLTGLASQGHWVEKAPTIANLLSVFYFPLYKYVFSYLLWYCSYSLYLCRFCNFLNSFSIHFRGIWGGKGDTNHILNLPHWTWSPRNTILE